MPRNHLSVKTPEPGSTGKRKERSPNVRISLLRCSKELPELVIIIQHPNYPHLPPSLTSRSLAAPLLLLLQTEKQIAADAALERSKRAERRAVRTQKLCHLVLIFF